MGKFLIIFVQIYIQVKRAFVDLNTFSSRNMSRDGNIDYQFWFDKTIEEKLAAAVVMIEV